MLSHKYYGKVGIENILLRLDVIVDQLNFKEFIHFVTYTNLLNDGDFQHFKIILKKAEETFSVDQVLSLIVELIIKELPDILNKIWQAKLAILIQEKKLFNYIISHDNKEMLSVINKVSTDVLFAALNAKSSDVSISPLCMKVIRSRLNSSQVVEIFKKNYEFENDKDSIQYLSENNEIKSSDIIDILKIMAKDYVQPVDNIINLLDILFEKMNKEEEKSYKSSYFDLMNLSPCDGNLKTTFIIDMISDEDVPITIQCELLKRARLKEEKITINDIRIKPRILDTIYENLSRNKEKLLEFLFNENTKKIIHKQLIPAFKYYYKKEILELHDFPMRFYLNQEKLNYLIVVKMLKNISVKDSEKLVQRLVPPFYKINNTDFSILIKGIEKLKKKIAIIKIMSNGLPEEELAQFDLRVSTILKKGIKDLEQKKTQYNGTLFNSSNSPRMNLDSKEQDMDAGEKILGKLSTQKLGSRDKNTAGIRQRFLARPEKNENDFKNQVEAKLEVMCGVKGDICRFHDTWHKVRFISGQSDGMIFNCAKILTEIGIKTEVRKGYTYSCGIKIETVDMDLMNDLKEILDKLNKYTEKLSISMNP
jgi:hypothetical protein